MKPPATSAAKTETPTEFLKRQPEPLREFYSAIIHELPPEYRATTAGFQQRSQTGQRPTPFCTLFRVKALVRTPKVKLWSRVVELIDPDGELVECILSAGTITGKPRDAVAKLSDHGLQVHNDYHLRTIAQLIRNWPVPPAARLTLVDRVGWMPDRDAFVLTSGRVLTRKGTPKKYQFGGERSGEELGSLSRWRDNIAGLAIGNTNMVFGISLGFSTALLEFSELNTLIFHFFGKTSTGKTRVLLSALTVWPRTSKQAKTWAGTITGLEAEIAKSSGILMGLDELLHDATPELHAVIYRISNNNSKAKGKKEGGAQDRDNWSSGVISSGEYSFVDTLRKLGGIPTGGQGVRMLDIPAIGHHGIFDNLHGSTTGEDFVHRLDKSLRTNWGHAGAAFVERLLELEVEALRANLDADLRRHEIALQQHLSVIAGDEKSNEILRVLRSFALVATAGEWASDWGLTGWETGEAYAAVQRIAERWLDGRGRLPFEQSQTLKKVQEYLTVNEHRFTPLSDAGSRPDYGNGGPVYQDETFIYLLPAALSYMARKLEITKTKQVLDALTEGGFLETGGEDKSRQFKLPAVVPNRPRAYRIRRTILDFEGEDDTSSNHPKGPEE
jgi:putative DNA primase/helicase